MTAKRNIIIISSSDSIEKLYSCSDQEYSFLYLGQDYNLSLKWISNLPGNFKSINFVGSLQSTAMKLRRLYIDYIGKLGQKYNSLAWWASKIAEKNTMNSSLYLYVCYLIMISNILEEGRSNVCVVSESDALILTIAKIAKLKGYNVLVCTRINNIYYTMRIYKSYLTRILFFLFKSLMRACVASTTRHTAGKELNKKDCTFMRTWVNDKCLGDDGQFKDIYYDKLSDYLYAEGKNVIIVPIIYKNKRAYRDVIGWFRKKGEQFLIPDDYYKLNDFISVVILGIKQLFLIREPLHFEGNDITMLVHEELNKTAFSVGMLEFCMYYYLMKRLRKKGFQIESFILTFENMFPEKPLIMGLRKYYPETKIIGFQHCVLYPLVLCQYISKDEVSVIPMPDRIVCSGKNFKYILSREGYPNEKLVVGPALRFAHILEQQKIIQPVNKHDLRKIVLIATPENINTTMELLLKVYRALFEEKDIQMWFKPHPMANIKKIREVLVANYIPKDYYEIVDNNVQDILLHSKAVIASSSGIIYDAIASGIPTIRVRLSAELNFDPADWLINPINNYTAITSEDIKAQVLKAIKIDEKKRNQLQEYGKNLISDHFCSINNETMTAFV